MCKIGSIGSEPISPALQVGSFNRLAYFPFKQTHKLRWQESNLRLSLRLTCHTFNVSLTHTHITGLWIWTTTAITQEFATSHLKFSDWLSQIIPNRYMRNRTTCLACWRTSVNLHVFTYASAYFNHHKTNTCYPYISHRQDFVQEILLSRDKDKNLTVDSIRLSSKQLWGERINTPMPVYGQIPTGQWRPLISIQLWGENFYSNHLLSR